MKSREVVSKSGIEMVDLQGIADENEMAKTMTRRIKEDQKKTLRVKKANERAD